MTCDASMSSRNTSRSSDESAEVSAVRSTGAKRALLAFRSSMMSVSEGVRVEGVVVGMVPMPGLAGESNATGSGLIRDLRPET